MKMMFVLFYYINFLVLKFIHPILFGFEDAASFQYQIDTKRQENVFFSNEKYKREVLKNNWCRGYRFRVLGSFPGSYQWCNGETVPKTFVRRIK